MAYSLYDLNREGAEEKLKVLECEARRGRYSNIPTEAEREHEKYLETARRIEREQWAVVVEQIRGYKYAPRPAYQ